MKRGWNAELGSCCMFTKHRTGFNSKLHSNVLANKRKIFFLSTAFPFHFFFVNNFRSLVYVRWSGVAFCNPYELLRHLLCSRWRMMSHREVIKWLRHYLDFKLFQILARSISSDLKDVSITITFIFYNFFSSLLLSVGIGLLFFVYDDNSHLA